MVVELRKYKYANEVAKALENEIDRTQSLLSEYLRRLDKIRVLAKCSKKVRNVDSKLAGKKKTRKILRETSIGDLNIVLGATPLHELSAIEEAAASQQDKLFTLQKAREDMKWVNQIENAEGLKYLVLEKDGVPTQVLLQTS